MVAEELIELVDVNQLIIKEEKGVFSNQVFGSNQRTLLEKNKNEILNRKNLCNSSKD